MSNNFEVNITNGGKPEIPKKEVDHNYHQQIETGSKKGIDFVDDVIPLGILTVMFATFSYLYWKAHKEEKENEGESDFGDYCENYHLTKPEGLYRKKGISGEMYDKPDYENLDC